MASEGMKEMCTPCEGNYSGTLSKYKDIYKCKKHFTKMLKDVGMVVPKIKETR